MCRGDGRSNGEVAKRGSVRPLAVPFHIGKLIAQGGHAERGKIIGHGRHEGMLDAGAGPRRNHHARLARGGDCISPETLSVSVTRIVTGFGVIELTPRPNRRS